MKIRFLQQSTIRSKWAGMQTSGTDIYRRNRMKINSTADLGNAIRKRRKELGYTQAFLAGHTGFSVSFISDLERGKKTAEIGKAITLINLLGMDLQIEKRE